MKLAARSEEDEAVLEAAAELGVTPEEIRGHIAKEAFQLNEQYNVLRGDEADRGVN
jgi:predicted transcriptional regulator